jgi:hypothetical protein
MSEPPIEEPLEDWLEQRTPADPASEREQAAPPDLSSPLAAEEADLLEQGEAISGPDEEYPPTDPTSEA